MTGSRAKRASLALNEPWPLPEQKEIKKANTRPVRVLFKDQDICPRLQCFRSNYRTASSRMSCNQFNQSRARYRHSREIDPIYLFIFLSREYFKLHDVSHLCLSKHRYQ